MNIKHYLVLVLVVIQLAACISHDESYYRLHPQALQTALKKCSTKQSGKWSCEQLAAIASRLNSLALELQHNPQGFGKQILAFQEALAQQQEDLRKNPNNFALKQTIATTKQQLDEHLAVVKWLESPEG